MNCSTRLSFIHKPILWAAFAALWLSPSFGFAFGTSKDLEDWSLTLCKRFQGSLKNKRGTVLSLPLEREDKAVTELGRLLSEKLAGKLQEKNISETADRDFSFKLAEELKGNGQSLEDPQTIREAGKFSGSYAVILGTIRLAGEKFKITLQICDTETSQVIKKTSRSLLANQELIKLYSQEIHIEPQKIPLNPPLQKGEIISQATVPVLDRTPDFGKLSRDYLAMEKKADPGSNQDMAALESLARGHIYFETQDYFSAANAYTKALSFKPDNVEPYYFRGIAFYKKNAILKTLEDFNKCKDLRPEDPSVWILCGLAYVKNNETSRAVEDFTKAIALDPKSGAAYYERGQLQQSRDDLINGCNLGWKPACDALMKLKR